MEFLEAPPANARFWRDSWAVYANPKAIGIGESFVALEMCLLFQFCYIVYMYVYTDRFAKKKTIRFKQILKCTVVVIKVGMEWLKLVIEFWKVKQAAIYLFQFK